MKKNVWRLGNIKPLKSSGKKCHFTSCHEQDDPSERRRFTQSSPLSKDMIVSAATSDTCAAPRPSVEAAGSRVSHRAIAGGHNATRVSLSAFTRRLGSRRNDDSRARWTTRTQRLWQVTQCRRSRWPSVCKTWSRAHI